MKIALISDTHFGYQRFEEDSFTQGRAAFLDACSKCNVILFTGDLFDVKIPKPETMEQVLSIFNEIRSRGKKVFAIHGNHERRPKEMINPLQLIAATGLVEYVHTASVIFEMDGEKVQLFGLGSVPERYALTALRKSLESFIPENGAFKILLIHQAIKDIVQGSPEEIAIDDLEQLPFDLIVNGHMHSKCIELSRKVIFPGSTVVTQIRPEETEPKGYVIYDTKTKNYEFIQLNCRKFIYEIMEFKEANQETVQQSVIKKIKELRGNDSSIIVAIKIRGTLREGLSNSDISFNSYENVLIDNQLNVATLSAKLERIRSLRSEKLSVRELALKELSEKTGDKLTLFDPNDVFEHLVQGAESTMQYLEEKNKPIIR